MKKHNKKLLTTMLAGMLCAATAGTVAAFAPVNASAATTPKKYDLSAIFSSNAKDLVKAEGAKTMVSLANDNKVQYNRNLAINWFEAEGVEKYTNIDFTFENRDFNSVTFTFKSLPMHATKDGIAINTLKFVKGEGNELKVSVNNAAATTIGNDSNVKIQLGASNEVGNYSISINEKPVGEFTNIGAKYFITRSADDDKDAASALEISAACADAKTAKLSLNSINGQSFAITDGKLVDNAKPVMVVNEDVSEFLLGTRFQLDYTLIDVLEQTVTSSNYYYQYNPTDEKTPADADYKYETFLEIKTNGTYFQETVYEKEGSGKTTVYRENGAEYVSIKFAVKDGTYVDGEGDYQKAEYLLSWYANKTHEIRGVDYLVFNRNTTGPNYKAYNENDVKNYNDALAEKAKDVTAGSNAQIELPSLAWLIEDANNGYNSLKFTISYKSQNSSSPSLISDKTSSELKIDVSKPGQYQFKVFATDAAGNAMYAKDEEGVDVKVTSSNVWDLESIPTFTYTVAAQGLKPGDNVDKDTLDTKNIGETYTMSAVDIVGIMGSKGSAYQLYKLNESKLQGVDVSQIKFATLQDNAKAIVNGKLKDGVSANEIDYAEVNKLAFAQAVAKRIGGNVDANTLVKELFTAIDEYNANIPADTEAWDNSDNKYEWKSATPSFKTVESGLYVILADYWDTDMEYVDHVPAYRLIEVNSPKDVIKGETEWLKNNLVSVILFSVAGLMLILIILLLLVKPSDETLEDVDAKVISKRKAATDKNKKK